MCRRLWASFQDDWTWPVLHTYSTRPRSWIYRRSYFFLQIVATHELVLPHVFFVHLSVPCSSDPLKAMANSRYLAIDAAFAASKALALFLPCSHPVFVSSSFFVETVTQAFVSFLQWSPSCSEPIVENHKALSKQNFCTCVNVLFEQNDNLNQHRYRSQRCTDAGSSLGSLGMRPNLVSFTVLRVETVIDIGDSRPQDARFLRTFWCASPDPFRCSRSWAQEQRCCRPEFPKRLRCLHHESFQATYQELGPQETPETRAVDHGPRARACCDQCAHVKKSRHIRGGLTPDHRLRNAEYCLHLSVASNPGEETLRCGKPACVEGAL